MIRRLLVNNKSRRLLSSVRCRRCYAVAGTSSPIITSSSNPPSSTQQQRKQKNNYYSGSRATLTPALFHNYTNYYQTCNLSSLASAAAENDSNKGGGGDNIEGLGSLVLPTHHSRKALPAVCTDFEELQRLTVEILDSEPGTLFAYPADTIAAKKKEKERKRQQQKKKNKNINDADDNIDGIDDDNSNVAWDVADITVQKVEYLLRGYSYCIPGTIWNRWITENPKEASKHPNPVAADVLDPSECIATMEMLLARLWDEGHMYMTMRKRSIAQVAYEEYRDSAKAIMANAQKQLNYKKKQKSLMSSLNNDDDDNENGSKNYDVGDDFENEELSAEELLQEERVAKIMDDEDFVKSLAESGGGDIPGFTTLMNDDDDDDEMMNLADPLSQALSASMSESNQDDSNNELSKLHPACVAYLHECIELHWRENSDMAKKRYDATLKNQRLDALSIPNDDDDPNREAIELNAVYDDSRYNPEKYYKDPNNVMKALRLLQDYEVEQFQSLCEKYNRDPMRHFASPGPTVQMYEIMLDAIASTTSPDLTASSLANPEEVMGFVENIVIRHTLDCVDDTKNTNVHTLPTIAGFNAALRCLANFKYSDNKEFRDEALMVGLSIHGMLNNEKIDQGYHNMPKKNSQTYYYLLQILDKYIPHHSYRIRFNTSFAMFQLAKKEGLLDDNIMKQLFQIFENNNNNNDEGSGKSIEYETFLKKFRFIPDDGSANDFDSTNCQWDQILPLKWRKNAKIRQSQPKKYTFTAY